MSDTRIPTLLGTAGTRKWDVRFSKEAIAPLSGNVTYAVAGMENGDVLTLFVTQDATGSRTLAFTYAAGITGVVVGATAAIASAASKATKAVLARAGNIVYITYDAQA